MFVFRVLDVTRFKLFSLSLAMVALPVCIGNSFPVYAQNRAVVPIPALSPSAAASLAFAAVPRSFASAPLMMSSESSGWVNVRRPANQISPADIPVLFPAR